MKNLFKFSLLLLLLNLTTLMASNVVATVNGEDITQEDVNKFVMASIPGARFSLLTEEQKEAMIKQMIERKLFFKEAKKVHIERDLEFKEALKKARESLMVDYWMKAQVKEIKISESEAKAYYRFHADKFNRPASVKVRHILVTTRGEAREIISQLRDAKNLREKFIELAETRSTGPSAVNGGELDWFIQEQMVPEFSNAAFQLREGSITNTPVKTQFGYHVIYLEKRKNAGLIPYNEVKPDIIKALRVIKFKTKLENLAKKMRERADISVK